MCASLCTHSHARLLIIDKLVADHAHHPKEESPRNSGRACLSYPTVQHREGGPGDEYTLQPLFREFQRSGAFSYSDLNTRRHCVFLFAFLQLRPQPHGILSQLASGWFYSFMNMHHFTSRVFVAMPTQLPLNILLAYLLVNTQEWTKCGLLCCGNLRISRKHYATRSHYSAINVHLACQVSVSIIIDILSGALIVA